MIVYCEECGAKNELKGVSQLSPDNPERCQFCNDILVIHHQPASDAETGSKTSTPLSRLILRYQDVEIEHKGADHQITMGRRDGNDIIVKGERVSRVHAVVVYKQGKY